MSETDIGATGERDRVDAATGTDAALSVARLPIPSSFKDAEKLVDTAFKAHRARVDAARKTLAQAEKAHESAVTRARGELDQAGRPAKIASIGVVRTVTLTETTIKTPKGEFRLTPDVEAAP